MGVTSNCHALKMPAADGKMRMTDVADQEQMFRLIQSIPSPKAEYIKRWIAQVASELEFTFDNWFRTLGVLYAAHNLKDRNKE